MRVYTQGSFDILHSGHIRLLKRCRRLAGEDGELIVSVINDESYEAYRGYPPTVPFNDRLTVISAIGLVDKTIAGDHRSTQNELITHRPDLVVLGSDWATRDPFAHYGITEEWLEEKGIMFLFLPRTKGVSSSAIKERIKP